MPYRLVSGKLSTNRRLASVSLEAVVLYLLSLPHHDRDGRLSGDPEDQIDEYVPAQARKRGWSEEDVERFGQELVEADLWSQYEADAVKVAVVLRHRDHQHPSRLASEKPSRFPDPPDSGNPPDTKAVQDRTDEYETVPQSNLIESKRSEEKSTRDDNALAALGIQLAGGTPPPTAEQVRERATAEILTSREVPNVERVILEAFYAVGVEVGQAPVLTKLCGDDFGKTAALGVTEWMAKQETDLGKRVEYPFAYLKKAIPARIAELKAKIAKRTDALLEQGIRKKEGRA